MADSRIKAFIKSKVKMGPRDETRTYEITGTPEQLDKLEQAFDIIEYMGAVGTSRAVNIGVDGDGAARLQFRKEGKELKTEAKLGDEEVFKVYLS